jgi:phenylacetate-coenzyme A ligase PaaK-like adenylate-forming protein
MSTADFLTKNTIFNISTDDEFNNIALMVFKYQYKNNAVYKQYCDLIKTNVDRVKSIKDIPFLPISFFKTHQVVCGDLNYVKEFTSSGTTGMTTSSHFVKDISIYEQSFIKGFELFYGPVEEYVILGLLPSYLERTGSSLIYMVDHLIKLSNHPYSGYFLNDYSHLLETISKIKNRKILLIGVSYALLDLAEQFKPDLSNCIVMETGGMKGKRKEIPKNELHAILKNGFNVNTIHSEYGMTELLSQAYAKKNGQFKTPPWMKILTREINDPLNYTSEHKSGGINIIDLANVNSCSFIATQDLGKSHQDHFEVLGRFDNSDIRGCNLLVQ